MQGRIYKKYRHEYRKARRKYQRHRGQVFSQNKRPGTGKRN
jgi:hypothetical protein